VAGREVIASLACLCRGIVVAVAHQPVLNGRGREPATDRVAGCGDGCGGSHNTACAASLLVAIACVCDERRIRQGECPVGSWGGDADVLADSEAVPQSEDIWVPLHELRQDGVTSNSSC